MSDDLDLGSGHILRWVRWAPDDLPANREKYGYPLPCIDHAGAIIYHLRPDGAEICRGYISFNLPEIQQHFPARQLWDVVEWEPLTLTPSIRCVVCGDHGFIKNGVWARA